MHVLFPAAVIVTVPAHWFLAPKSCISNERECKLALSTTTLLPFYNLHLYISVVCFLHHHISSVFPPLPFIVALLLLFLVISIFTLLTYIEDITRWREDMNFMFEWQEHKIHIFEPTCNVLFIIWRNQFNKSKRRESCLKYPLAVLVQTPAAHILMYCNASSTAFPAVRCFQFRKKVLGL